MFKNYLLEVIPKPESGTAAILCTPDGFKGPIFQGEGTNNYLCGVCKYVLCKKIIRQQIVEIVFECPECKSYNRIKGR
ncbi:MULTISPECIES: hypothetical protein [Bacillus cereus group]|uniref:hypothetical protein n=1 Tax=Bacillus cereus group TaxID=86661 RepID=UPI001E5B061E|nr:MULTISPECIES: hypothetical protein [Bacillus cereus group]MCC2502210.1 hypothetical protein [Bacillus paranthracis]MDF9578903.1 hypothetical protein [Bacillus paranthracis]MDG1613229.1 hypothetical protein [Bacillus paranthracis]